MLRTAIASNSRGGWLRPIARVTRCRHRWPNEAAAYSSTICATGAAPRPWAPIHPVRAKVSRSPRLSPGCRSKLEYARMLSPFTGHPARFGQHGQQRSPRPDRPAALAAPDAVRSQSASRRIASRAALSSPSVRGDRKAPNGTARLLTSDFTTQIST